MSRFGLKILVCMGHEGFGKSVECPGLYEFITCLCIKQKSHKLVQIFVEILDFKF